MKDWTVSMSDVDIDAALEAARRAPAETLGISAEYLGGRADVVIVRLNTGGRLVLPREDLQGLSEATDAQLSEIKLWNGTGISWPQLNVDHDLRALLEHRYGSKKWMEGLRRRGIAA